MLAEKPSGCGARMQATDARPGLAAIKRRRRGLQQTQQRLHAATRKVQVSVQVQASSGPKDPVQAARQPQLQATEVLTQLLKSTDLTAASRQLVDHMSEEFFMVGSTYLDMAKKEGEPEVVERLELVLRAAMEAKNATLRPEIRLLNQLLGCEEDAQARKQLLNRQASGDALTSDDGYFFKLLEQVTADVVKQPENPRKASLLQWLAQIKVEANQRLQPK